MYCWFLWYDRLDPGSLATILYSLTQFSLTRKPSWFGVRQILKSSLASWNAEQTAGTQNSQITNELAELGTSRAPKHKKNNRSSTKIFCTVIGSFSSETTQSVNSQLTTYLVTIPTGTTVGASESLSNVEYLRLRSDSPVEVVVD